MPNAKGRIWSGEVARALRLVDELGGFDTAIREVKRLIKVKESESIKLKQYPPKKSPLEALAQMLSGEGGESSEEAGGRALLSALESLRPLIRAARAAGIAGRAPGEVEMILPAW